MTDLSIYIKMTAETPDQIIHAPKGQSLPYIINTSPSINVRPPSTQNLPAILLIQDYNEGKLSNTMRGFISGRLLNGKEYNNPLASLIGEKADIHSLAQKIHELTGCNVIKTHSGGDYYYLIGDRNSK